MEDRSSGEYIGAIALIASVDRPAGPYKPQKSGVPSVVLPILIHTEKQKNHGV